MSEEDKKIIASDVGTLIFTPGPDKPWPTGTITYEVCNYMGKAVYDRTAMVFTVYDRRDNIVAHLDYELASMVAGLFDVVVSKEVIDENRINLRKPPLG